MLFWGLRSKSVKELESNDRALYWENAIALCVGEECDPAVVGWEGCDRACCVGEDAITVCIGRMRSRFVLGECDRALYWENAIALVVLGRMRSRFGIRKNTIALVVLGRMRSLSLHWEDAIALSIGKNAITLCILKDAISLSMTSELFFEGVEEIPKLKFVLGKAEANINQLSYTG
ncbi:MULTISPECIES: hypothetical protein [Cyanophyceae]|uniref:hypothetical protein n=1 Tax=Cyanophyceae TaxID=3028117 RepID=UPI0016884BC3|nr:hypothetical protein [Trichocoleus sp. FACHB-40]MBD2003772.1 hypothetical protein [Trichocoleus sp. FACHB-40]